MTPDIDRPGEPADPGSSSSMTVHEPGRIATSASRVHLASAAAAGVALSLVALTTVVLLWAYRPENAAGFAPPGGVDWSRVVVQLHQVLLGVALVLCVVWAVVSSVVARRRTTSQLAVVVVAGVASVICTLAASLAWGLVKWEQVALWVVTIGADTDGLWSAAFADDVRFVVVGGAEVAQGAYARFLVVFVVAPFAALAAVAAGWRASRPASTVDAAEVSEAQ